MISEKLLLLTRPARSCFNVPAGAVVIKKSVSVCTLAVVDPVGPTAGFDVDPRVDEDEDEDEEDDVNVDDDGEREEE